MELDKISFHGSLESIKKLENSLKDLPASIITQKRNGSSHLFFDADLIGTKVALYPKYVSEELEISCPTECKINKEYVDFSLNKINYRIFLNKKYSNKSN